MKNNENMSKATTWFSLNEDHVLVNSYSQELQSPWGSTSKCPLPKWSRVPRQIKKSFKHLIETIKGKKLSKPKKKYFTCSNKWH